MSTTEGPPLPPKITRKPPNRNGRASVPVSTSAPQLLHKVSSAPPPLHHAQTFFVPQSPPSMTSGPSTQPIPVFPQPGISAASFPYFLMKPSDLQGAGASSGPPAGWCDPTSRVVPFPMPFAYIAPPWASQMDSSSMAAIGGTPPVAPAAQPADVSGRVREKLIAHGTPAHLIYATPGGAVGRYLTSFILRLSPVVEVVESVMALLRWKSIWRSLAGIATWVLLCLHPIILSVLPHLVLVMIVYRSQGMKERMINSPPTLCSQPRSSMASVTSTTSTSSSKTLQNIPSSEDCLSESKIDDAKKHSPSLEIADSLFDDEALYKKEVYARNLRFFEDATEHFCVIYDQVHTFMCNLETQQSEKTPMITRILLSTLPFPLLAIADPLIQNHFGSLSPPSRISKYPNSSFWFVTVPMLILGICAFLYHTPLNRLAVNFVRTLTWLVQLAWRATQKRPSKKLVDEAVETTHIEEQKPEEEPQPMEEKKKSMQDVQRERTMSEETFRFSNWRRKTAVEVTERVEEGEEKVMKSSRGNSVGEAKQAKVGRSGEEDRGSRTGEVEFPLPFAIERRREPTDCEIVEVFENQRWWAGSGWTSNLLHKDPPRWSDDTGHFVYQPVSEYPLPGLNWEWVDYWKTCGKDERQNDGWEYFDNDWKNPTPQPTMASLTRRRKWIRYMRRK